MAKSNPKLKKAIFFIRQAIDEVRKLLVAETTGEINTDAVRQKIIESVKLRLEAIARPHYRKVVNATGIILHTALGRAVLPAQALRQIQNEMAGYSLLQSDTETGKRSRRDGCIEELLQP